MGFHGDIHGGYSMYHGEGFSMIFTGDFMYHEDLLDLIIGI